MPYVADTFNRTNSASSIGTADTGQTWSNNVGSVFGIQSNRAYCVAPSQASFTDTASVPKNIATVDFGDPDMPIAVDLITSPTTPNVGLVGRYIDANNYLLANLSMTTYNGVTVLKNVGGTFTVLDSFLGPPYSPGATYRMDFDLVGDQWAVHIAGALILSGTLTSGEMTVFGAATRAGLYLGSGKFMGTAPNDPGDSRFDNFQIGEPTPRFTPGFHTGIRFGQRPAA